MVVSARCTRRPLILPRYAIHPPPFLPPAIVNLSTGTWAHWQLSRNCRRVVGSPRHCYPRRRFWWRVWPLQMTPVSADPRIARSANRRRTILDHDGDAGVRVGVAPLCTVGDGDVSIRLAAAVQPENILRGGSKLYCRLSWLRGWWARPGCAVPLQHQRFSVGPHWCKRRFGDSGEDARVAGFVGRVSCSGS